MNYIIKEISGKEFKESIASWSEPWYKSFIRGYVSGNEIIINKDALFIFPSSKQKLIQHEIGHIEGKEHTWIPWDVMCWYGICRL